MVDVNFIPGSYRDRSARVFEQEGRIYRAMSAEAMATWRTVSSRGSFNSLCASGQIIQTRVLDPSETEQINRPDWAAAVLEHACVPFVSYPYEWSFRMLREAALLHLEILGSLLGDGLILKDATPYNVQFEGCRARFIDAGSFVEHQAGAAWNGYRQFCELMLIPLLLQSHRGLDLRTTLRGNLEGVTPDAARNWLSWRDLIRPGVWTHIWLHGWLDRLAQRAPTQTPTVDSINVPIDSLKRSVRSLQKLVQSLEWKAGTTVWTHYDRDQPHVQLDREAKLRQVETVVSGRYYQTVWDLGCQRGIYSRMAARHAHTVVAMDEDHGCIDDLFRDLQASGPGNILPLRINLANPSPGQGWRGRERLRLEERGRPDLVMCLGLIHHLVIAANIPLPDVVEWLADLQATLILEFPLRNDPLVQTLLRNKPDHYDDYSLENLNDALKRAFDIQDCQLLPSGSRYLITAVPKS